MKNKKVVVRTKENEECKIKTGNTQMLKNTYRAFTSPALSVLE